MKNLFLVSIIFFLYGISNAQVGINTTDPKAMLDVNGAIINREIEFSISSNTAIINLETSLAKITGTATASIVITATVPSINGQRLIIYNNSTGGFPAVFNGTTIPNLQSVEFIYTNGFWKSTFGGTNPAGFNIYSSDGTIAGNRIVTQGANNLTFSGTGNTIFNVGKVGIGSTPLSDFSIFQSSGFSNARGIRLTGNSIGGTSTGTGFSISLGYNVSGNKQLWLGDADNLGSSSGTFIRYNGSGLLDAVSGDNTVRRAIAIGVAGDPNSGVIFGTDNTNVAPTSYVWANGNMAIGSSYKANAAPANGLIVEGNMGVGTGATVNAKLHVNGTTAFTTATSGTAKTVILQNAGTFTVPTAATSNSGLMYIIRNTSTASNLTVNSIIGYGASTATSFSLTPTLGSIMIISDGSNWYRIM